MAQVKSLSCRNPSRFLNDESVLLDSNKLLDSHLPLSLAALANNHFSSNNTFGDNKTDFKQFSVSNILDDACFVLDAHSDALEQNKDDINLDLNFLNDLCNNEIYEVSAKVSDLKINDIYNEDDCLLVLDSQSGVITTNEENCNLDLIFLNGVSSDSVEKGSSEANNLKTNDNESEGFNPINDVDLSFCVKGSNTKWDFLSSSPESRDSGFDETLLHEYVENDSRKSVLYNPEPSLLSKALSSKTRSDPIKKQKALKVKKDLCRKHLNHWDLNFLAKKLVMDDNIVDMSNTCMLSHSMPYRNLIS